MRSSAPKQISKELFNDVQRNKLSRETRNQQIDPREHKVKLKNDSLTMGLEIEYYSLELKKRKLCEEVSMKHTHTVTKLWVR